MCYICNCFSWTLDLIQRILTFILTCWLTFAVCCGFVVAIVAGMAYGYNYSIVEFLTLTNSDDVGIYMRRGQYDDNPDIMYPKGRVRVNDTDYQKEIQASENSLQIDKWQQNDGTETYREKVTKYSETRGFLDYEQVQLPQRTKMESVTPHRVAIMSISPTLRLSTLMKHRASSNIVMKMFEPMRTKTKLKIDFAATKSYYVKDIKHPEENKALDKIITADHFRKKILTPDIRIVFDDFTKSTHIKMRHFWPTTPPSIMETEPSSEQILLKII